MGEYLVNYRWRGDTQAANYSRDAEAQAPGTPAIHASVSGDYGGNDTMWNPETLLGTSICQCHTLTFLALAHKAGLGVRAIETAVTVTLGRVDRATQVTHITLAARIGVAPGTDHDTPQTLYGKAHTYCFIANSLKSTVEWTTEIYETEA